MADPSVQPKVTARGKTMVGARMMGREHSRIADQIEGRVQGLAAGEALDPVNTGQTVQRASERFIKQSGQALGRRYERLEKATEGLKVPAAAASSRIDELTARLSEMPEANKAELSFLQALKSDLGSDLSIGTLRRLRTKLRQSIAKGDLTFGEDEANVLSIMDAASDDIANGLAAVGKRNIANEFKAVDAAYRDRMEFIHGTIQKLVGKRGANVSPEQVAQRLKAMASPRGDSAALARMLREMTPEERGDIAATFADALGKNSDGQFSTAFLVKHLQKLPEAARINLFGPNGAKSLANLETLAKEHKRVTAALGGSPTALATDARSWVLNLIFGGGVGLSSGAVEGVAAGAALGAAKLGRDALSARALMSPKITGWIRSIPKTQDPKAINAHWDRLSAIAVREPALAPEVQRLQEAIMRALNDNATQVGQLAASPNEGPEGDTQP
jgi:hypothetical protein